LAFDAAGGEEGAHAVVAPTAVHVRGVVGAGELALAEVGQELVEGVLPGGEVQGCRLGEHTVEVEQAGPDLGRQAEGAQGVRRGRGHADDASAAGRGGRHWGCARRVSPLSALVNTCSIYGTRVERGA